MDGKIIISIVKKQKFEERLVNNFSLHLCFLQIMWDNMVLVISSFYNLQHLEFL
jgi:hypothetical protein